MRLRTTYVEVDIEDVLSDVPTKELVQYVLERNVKIDKPDGTFEALVAEAYDDILEGDIETAKLRLEQALFPRFKTFDDCMKLYLKAKAEATT